MNFSLFFLSLQCVLASIILVRKGQYRPQVMIVQDKTGAWGLPYFPGVRSTAKDLEFFNFRLRDDQLRVEEIKVGHFDYKIVYKHGDRVINADPAFQDPFQAAMWIPLKAFVSGSINPPVHDSLTVASHSDIIIKRIVDIFPSLKKHAVPVVVPVVNVRPDVGVRPAVDADPAPVVNVRPNVRPDAGGRPVADVAPAVKVVPAAAVGLVVGIAPVVITRLNGFGVAEVLVDVSGNEINIPFVNMQSIIGMFKCTLKHATHMNQMPVCRINYDFDGRFNDNEMIDGIFLKWIPVDSAPFMNDIVGPKEMEAFLKRNVLDPWSNINPNSKHGSQSKVAVLRGTAEVYSRLPQLQSSSVLGMKSLERIPYKSDFVIPKQSCKTLYSFVGMDTFKAAVDVLESRHKSHVMVVNFANNSTPGGGYMNGANAQEEDLFRSSNLPWILGQQGKNANLYPINDRTTANALFNTNCHIMRDRSTGYSFYPSEKIIQYSVSVCSIAAFNIKRDKFAFEPASSKFNQLGADVTKQRIHVMFQMAIQKKVDTLVLGAFGCGAFGNDPATIRSYFEEIMKVYHNQIPHVLFAVINPGKSKDGKNLEIFKKIQFPQ